MFNISMGIQTNTIDKSVLPRLAKNQPGTALWIQPLNRQIGLTGELAEAFAAGGCTTARIPAYWIGHDHDRTQGSRHARSNGEKVILFFHGGGFRSYQGSPSTKGPMNNLNLLLKGVAKARSIGRSQTGPQRALSVEYRLTNEATFPAILADALAAWVYLVRDQHFRPGDIILAGDSAGGTIALALARYIRDERPLTAECHLLPDGPIADSLVLLSPWADVSMSFVEAGPSSSAIRNKATDYLSVNALRVAREDVVRGLPVPFVTSRWISPVCTARSIEDDLFFDFPRTFITAG